MEKSRKVFAIFAVLAALAQSATGGDPKTDLRDFAVRTWSGSEGFTDAPVTAITQTRDGYLWVGTGAGLFRFDGLSFQPTQLSREGTNTQLFVTSLCEDNSGNLWIGTREQGIYRWQNGEGVHFGVVDGLLDPGITSLALDNQGNVWIGTARGVDRFDGRQFKSFTTADGLQDNSVLNVHAALSGTVWITTTAGTCRFVNGQMSQYHFPPGHETDQELLQIYEDSHSNLWAFCSTYLINLADEKRVNYFSGEKSARTRLWNLCEGRGGRLWIGASGRGVYCFDGTKFQPVTLNEGRWPNDVKTIFEDHEGNLWLGISDVGLVQLRPQIYSLLTENRGLPPGAAACVTMDKAGRLIVGMESGGIYGKIVDRFQPINGEDPFLKQESVSALCAAPDGSVWAGTSGLGLYQLAKERTAVYTTANGLADDFVPGLCVGSDGTLWSGTRFGGVQRIAQGRMNSFVVTNVLFGTPVTAIIPTHSGGLWVGTANGTLVHAQNEFKSTLVAQLSPELTGKAILGLCESTNGGLWIGTDGGGLGYLNREVRRAWDYQDGLPDNIVWGMVEDEEGNLWLATPRGLCRINGDSILQAIERAAPLKTELVYETDKGPPKSAKYGGPRALRTSGGRLWFALNSGLVGVDIRGRETDRPAPLVHIDSVLVNNQVLKLATAKHVTASTNMAYVFPSNPQTVEFHYTGLSFSAPEKVRFRHKLDGIDADWVQSGSERQIGYGPLPHGNYLFHVTACNAEGIWNEQGANLAFVIPIPFWRGPLALSFGGVTAAALGVGVVRLVSHRRLRGRLRNLEQQRAMERERMRIAQNMHDEIGSKLTKISYLSERANVELRGTGKAEGKIDSIATTSRELLKALDEIVWAVNPQNDSLEHLAAYFCQYAREYFENTTVECDLRMQSTFPHVEMSAEIRHNLFLAFEESLNNVLKHAKASRVGLDISCDPEYLRISINDNGCGFEPTSGQGGKATGGNGLRNLRQRLSAVGGECVIESSPGRGARINLSVPLYSDKIRKR